MFELNFSEKKFQKSDGHLHVKTPSASTQCFLIWHGLTRLFLKETLLFIAVSPCLFNLLKAVLIRA